MNFPLFEFVVGWGFFLSFLTFVFCLATLHSHVDEAKLRQEKSASSVARSAIPPERVLTATGLRRVRTAKIALGCIVVFVAATIVQKLQLK